MNTNLIHNIINVALTVVGGMMVMDWSLIAPEYAGMIMGGLGFAKLIMNTARDGLSGLMKNQPPVQ